MAESTAPPERCPWCGLEVTLVQWTDPNGPRYPIHTLSVDVERACQGSLRIAHPSGAP